jgi:hypothetical protein
MSTQNKLGGQPALMRRRSQRAILSLPINVRSVDGNSGKPAIEESTQTLVVNEHGALIPITAKIENGQALHLTNRTTGEGLNCHVRYIGAISGGKTQVGVEFDEPAPNFWRIAFPPENWTSPEPEPVVQKGKK